MNVDKKVLSEIISGEATAKVHYRVPPFQRPYSWGRQQWDALLGDIDASSGMHFMGAVICVRDGGAGMPDSHTVFDLIDGQQRLTTLSILLLAAYDRLKAVGSDQADTLLHERVEETTRSIRNKLLLRQAYTEDQPVPATGWIEGEVSHVLRLQPGEQKNNLADYRHLFKIVGLSEESPKPRFFGNRRLSQAFEFFSEQLAERDTGPLLALIDRVQNLLFVFISVDSQADAFTLFETLNNRGVPLSAMDIVKNQMLARMEQRHGQKAKQSFLRWKKMLDPLPEERDQERLLRHTYNAYRWDPAVEVEGVSRAIRSKLIEIYQKLIDRDAPTLFERLEGVAARYAHLVAPRAGKTGFSEAVEKRLLEMNGLGASPANQVLLYLTGLDERALETGTTMPECIDLMHRYYVRRAVTGVPLTGSLDTAHIQTIAACQERIDSGVPLSVEFFRERVLDAARPAPAEQFAAALRGPLYDTNSDITRYLLVQLDRHHHTREYAPDLSARKGQRFVWTIEHVLPQKKKVSDEWIRTLGVADREEAAGVRAEQVHRLGNLTLSAFNSRLAAAPFEEKQKKIQRRDPLGVTVDIGYRNGLALNRLAFDVDGNNTSLAEADRWTAAHIEARTQTMVDLLLRRFAIKGLDPEP